MGKVDDRIPIDPGAGTKWKSNQDMTWERWFQNWN